MLAKFLFDGARDAAAAAAKNLSFSGSIKSICHERSLNLEIKRCVARNMKQPLSCHPEQNEALGMGRFRKNLLCPYQFHIDADIVICAFQNLRTLSFGMGGRWRAHAILIGKLQ